MANSTSSIRSGAVGFIDWLGWALGKFRRFIYNLPLKIRMFGGAIILLAREINENPHFIQSQFNR